jgi:hypothetical protein
MNAPYVNFDISQLQQFRKKDLIRYVIPSLDIAPEGSVISLPTLEGEVTISAGEETLVMIGPCRDLYPVTATLFSQQYRIISGSAENVADLVRHMGWNPEFLRPCRLKVSSYVYAKAVDQDFRVFVREHNTSLYGKAGDYYVVNVDRPNQPYIIQADVLAQTYEKVERIL